MIRPALDVVKRGLSNAGRPLRLLARRSLVPNRAGTWLSLSLAPPLDEIAPPRLPFSGGQHLGLLELLQLLRVAGEDPHLDGVLLRLEGAPRGFASVLAVRRAVEQLRARGKRVVAYGVALELADLVIASAADRIFLPDTGQILLIGLRADSFFFKGALDRFGVEADVVRIGRSKTAAEMFTHERMSDAQREQLGELLDDLYDDIVDGLARGRGLAPDRVRELIDTGPYTAHAAVEQGLADGCHYEDQLPEVLEPLTPIPDAGSGPRQVQLIDGLAYHALAVADAGWIPLFGELPRLAYVVLAGGIRRGGGMRGIASDTALEMLGALRRDPSVRGVVLRVVSPGGDGLASDLLWREIERMRRDKPVVASMGDVAASGGYYIASAADAVLAESATVTGSIGVVGGKLNLEGLYERLGVGRDAVERGARAGMFSETRAFTPGERKAVRAGMETLYDAFLDRVASGRGLSREAVSQVAGGRVWSGRRALGAGLVDRIGGPLEALREVRRLAGFREGERLWVDVHPRIPRLAGLRGLFGTLTRR